MMGQRGRSDEDIVLFFKVFPCNKEYNHDFAACFNTHKGDKARRRCLLQHSYGAKMCPDMKNTGKCPRGDSCDMTHSLFEYWLHPMRYRTKMCKDAANCSRPYCFFAHQECELRKATPAPQPLAAFTNIINNAAGAASSSAAAPGAAVTAPQTPNKHAGTLLLRQLSDRQRELLLGLDTNSSSLFGLQDSCAASAPTAYTQFVVGAGSASSSSSDVLPVLDMPACTAAGLFPVAAAGSSPLAGYFPADPSPLALDAISSCIARSMPAVMPNNSPQQADLYLQQQQDSANTDHVSLAALLQRMGVGGTSGGTQSVGTVGQPPPPPRMSSPSSRFALDVSANPGQVQVIQAGSPHHGYLMAQQQQPQQLVQLVSVPAPMAAAPNLGGMYQTASGLVMGNMSSNQASLQMQQQLQMQQLQVQQEQQQHCPDVLPITSPLPSPAAAAPPGASELSFSSMLPAATLSVAVLPEAAAGLTVGTMGSFAQQFQHW